MLKANREITDVKDIEAILRRARICHLAMTDGETPYVVPVNFGYEAGRFYVHSSNNPKGKKLSMLAANDRVCFSVVADVSLVTGEKPCDYTTNFRSVIGFGRARLLETDEEKIAGLSVIMRCHDGPTEGFRPEVVKKTAVIEIHIESMTGKSLPGPAKVASDGQGGEGSPFSAAVGGSKTEQSSA